MNDIKEIQVLGRRVRLLQAPDGFTTAIDSVLLGAACPANEGQSVLDLGCGVGSAGFCVLARVSKTTLDGIDIQEREIDLAAQNAKLNNMSARTTFTVRNVLDHIQNVKNGSGDYDHVICNPPYMKIGDHLPSPNAPKATAHADQDNVSIQSWVDGAFYSLKQGGSLTIIHRADQTDKIIQGLGKRFGAVQIIPLWPRESVDAKRVIIRSIKGRKTPATLCAGITLHQDNGDYTQAAENILREAKAIL